ncbi:hypothetical protein YC2023_032853 [Brassica napus]
MSNMMIIKNQLRSISLPSKSHPSTTGIEEALSKVKAINTTTGSSESILMALASLEELYSCTEEFLKIGSTQRVMSSSDASEFMEEMLDGSLRLMDTCSVSRDLMVETHCNSPIPRRPTGVIEGALWTRSCTQGKMEMEGVSNKLLSEVALDQPARMTLYTTLCGN